jgi:hypothetical protein
MTSTFRERRFAPSDVRRILRSAALLAETDPATAAVERTLTAGEIARIAADLGLPASAVERAIASPGAPEGAGDGPWLSPRTVSFEQDFSGELSVDRHEDIVEALRAATGVPGRVEVLGKTLIWSLTSASMPLVTLRVRDGRTVVRVEERLHGAAGLAAFASIALIPSLMAWGLAMDIGRSSVLAGAAAVVTMLCALVASTLFVRRNVRRREAFLRQVMERVTLAVGSAVQTAATPPPATSAAPPRARIAAPPAAGGASPEGPNAHSAELEAAAELEVAEAEAAAGEVSR